MHIFCLTLLGLGHTSIAHADTPSHTIPTPTFVKEKASPDSTALFNIDRIAGCHGAREKARDNIVPANGILNEPRFENEKWIPSIFSVPKLQKATCVLDDEPIGVQEYYEEPMSYTGYLMKEYECACAECWDEKGQSVDEDEIIASATEKDKKEYAVYEKKRQEEIAQATKQHQKYKAEYQQWLQLRKEHMSPEAIRITISPQKDIPAGQLSIYHFSWDISSFCGDVDHADRKDLVAKQFSHPPISAGTSLHIWLDGADTDLSWGIVLHNTEQQIDADMQAIMQTTRELIEHNQQVKYENRIPLQTAPKHLNGRIFETQDARSSSILDQCCAC